MSQDFRDALRAAEASVSSLTTLPDGPLSISQVDGLVRALCYSMPDVVGFREYMSEWLGQSFESPRIKSIIQEIAEGVLVEWDNHLAKGWSPQKTLRQHLAQGLHSRVSPRVDSPDYEVIVTSAGCGCPAAKGLK